MKNNESNKTFCPRQKANALAWHAIVDCNRRKTAEK